MRHCHPDISPHLTSSKWRILLETPENDVDSVENYRPVSNLPVLSKTLERVVSQQIESYLGAAGLLPRH